jgi:lanosterol synthase
MAESAMEAARRAAHCLAARQRQGHWPSDYSGPLFLLPGLIIAYHVTRTAWSPAQIDSMLVHLRKTQNRDGGWGLHVEGESTVLGTTLNYVALRLLGVAPTRPDAARARQWLHDHGGAEGIPTWGKFYLCVLGIYRWDGINPLCPELWLLPRWIPFHPGNLWCHTRSVFLPMCFIYGRRLVAEETELTRELRKEVFVTPYEELDWARLRDTIAPGDVYTPHSRWLRFANCILNFYELRPWTGLRKRALSWVQELIQHEDESTGYLTIGPVSKVLHMIAAWCEDPRGRAFERHLQRVPDYLWEDRDGLKMQGYNGSQLWDVAFAMRAFLEFRRLSGAPSAILDEALKESNRFLHDHQVRQNVDHHRRYYRDASVGAWPFSTVEQAWPVSDCSGEALKTVLEMESCTGQGLPRERLEQAACALLRWQNRDGGWSEYERSRGGRFLEKLNASEVFGDIMIAYSYTECTASCLLGLSAFQSRYPDFLERKIKKALARGAAFIRTRQRPDGGFYGGWGVCFTYGTWFAIEGLLAAGPPHCQGPTDPAITAAVQFLLALQRPDGAWGEAFASCVQGRYVQHSQGQVVQTAWAMLALAVVFQKSSSPRIHDALGRAAHFLIARQRADGGWDRESLAGVFNRNCAINYDNYRFIFPLWALARFAALEKARLASGPGPVN